MGQRALSRIDERMGRRTVMKLILTLCIGIIFIACIGWYCKRADESLRVVTILEAEDLYNIEILHPTVEERQKHMNRHGANVKVDGIEGPETQAGAHRARFNQYAEPCYTESGAPEK